MPFPFLLVEDDPDDPRLLRRALADVPRPLELRLVTDGRRALEMLHAASPFLVLSDVHLPGASGWDILAFVRAQPRLAGLPVLLWTSLPSLDGARRALELGADGYLGKPRDLDGYRRIAARVAAYLGD